MNTTHLNTTHLNSRGVPDCNIPCDRCDDWYTDETLCKLLDNEARSSVTTGGNGR